MSQQTSATTCKAPDFYYSIKIRQMPGISVDINNNNNNNNNKINLENKILIMNFLSLEALQ